MSDRDEIVELINLYALAVDTQRWDLFDRVFAPDCDADYGTSAHWTDLAGFKADFASFHAPFDATQHMMMNHQVRVAGDAAASLTYGSWRLVRLAAPGLSPLWDGTGWYDDAWVRTGEGWRIARRVCRVIWFTGNEAVKETIPGVVFEDERTTLRREAAAGALGFLRTLG
jgi:hypothetical protein